MTNKPENQSNRDVSNYYKEVETAKKQVKVKPDKRVEPFHPDRLPGSQLRPAKKSIARNKIIKYIFNFMILCVILGSLWYFSAGPGYRLLDNALKTMAGNRAIPQSQASLVKSESATSPSVPSETPKPSQTGLPPAASVQAIIPSYTPVLRVDTHTPTITPVSVDRQTPAGTPDCYNAIDITLADVGKTLCVRGIIINTINNPTNFMVIFSAKTSAFYWVTYDLVWSSGEVGRCYQTTGKIDRISNNPVMVFNYSNFPKECP